MITSTSFFVVFFEASVVTSSSFFLLSATVFGVLSSTSMLGSDLIENSSIAKT